MQLAPWGAHPALGASHTAAPRATQSREGCAPWCPAAPRLGPGHHPGSQCPSLERAVSGQTGERRSQAVRRLARGPLASRSPRLPCRPLPTLGCLTDLLRGGRGPGPGVAWRPDLAAATGGGGAAPRVGRSRRAEGPRCARVSAGRALWRQSREGRGAPYHSEFRGWWRQRVS